MAAGAAGCSASAPGSGGTAGQGGASSPGTGGSSGSGAAGTGQSAGAGGSGGAGGGAGTAGSPGSGGGAGAGGSVVGAGGAAGASGGSAAGTSGTGGGAGRGGTTGAAGRGGAGASGGGGTGGMAGARGGAGGTAGTTGAGGSGPARTACTAPAAYRNLFVEMLGKTQADVDGKVNTAFMQLFHGTGQQPIYYELGADQAFIQDIANNDVRSEGVSYGMFITVTLGMKTEFDKLWKFASTRMRQANGLFAWQLNTSGGIISSGDAPDGDEYFAEALMLASKKWGDSGTFNYGADARAAMNALATQGPFNANPVIVRFGLSSNFTDASYVLPLFYSEWACFDTANATMWRNATTYARTFFQNATNATTGLAPDHSGYDGSPMGNFGSDAWRVPMNIMMDANLNSADPWQAQTYAPRMATFWRSQGNYGNGYTLSGTATSTGHGAGLTAVNAMLSFSLSTTDAKPFLQAAWDAAIPTGTYRYYDGCLYLLAMLHMSGKFTLGY
ncbi:MAG TPA: glycosyl hydrolase family 8 [Polyangia bacterium]